mgnify:CR=1 FL=1
MREKLTKIIEAYEDVQAKMGDPAVLADQKEYNRLAKEYANQVLWRRRRASTCRRPTIWPKPGRCWPIRT